jgi:putative resolvase
MDFDILVVEHKDRLTRFGFNYIDTLFNYLNKKIEVVNNVDNDKEDLIQDFISVITSFCARIYGLRRSRRRTEKLIDALKNNKDLL